MKIELAKETPIRNGLHKHVYEHPENPDLLVKIWNPSHIEPTKRRRLIRVTPAKRVFRFSRFLNEIVEELAAREQGEETAFLETPVGLVDTDLGFGLVVEAVRRADGRLARNLREIVQLNLFGAEHEQALHELFAWMHRTEIIVHDFKAHNMVWDETRKRFVIIDGLGAEPGVCLRHLSIRYNRWQNRKKVRHLLEKLRQMKCPLHGFRNASAFP